MKFFTKSSCYVHWRKIGHTTGMLLLLFLLVGCGGAATNTPPTPTPATSTLAGGFTTFDLKLPPQALNAPVKGPLPDNTPLHVEVTFKTNQAVLDKLKKNNQSTNLAAQANQLGISDQTYQKIKDLFGVTDANLKLDGLHTYLTIDAKAKTFALVFQTSFMQHTLNGRTFYAPTSNPKIPNFIASQVIAISGLDSFSPPAQPHLSRQSQTGMFHTQGQKARDDCSVAGNSIKAIAHAYGYDQLWNKSWQGQDMTVNMLEFGPITQDDYQTFAQCTNSQTKITTVDVDGAPDPNNPDDAANALEATLDVEMVQALAPQATIVDYQSGFGGDAFWGHFNDELRQIIKDNEQNSPAGSVVSISYGLAETAITDNERAAIDQSMQILIQAEHMTIFVASGDCGAFDSRQYNTLDVDYPSVSPWTTAVGGTKLTFDNNANRSDEVVWSDGSDQTKCGNQWGSGGGNSTLYPRPDWQKADGVDNKYSDNHRQIPDISAMAYDLPVFFNGKWLPVRGTSAAAPIWAAGFSLADQGLIAQTQTYLSGPETFYDVANYQQTQKPYFDVTQGNNLYYPAGPNWDYASGLGTPNLMDFCNTMVALSKQS